MMKSVRIAMALTLMLGLSLGLAGVSAAQTMVTVEGHVYDDDSGDPISNAHVTAQNQETSQIYDIYTDGSGYYECTLESGNYQVTVTAEGYEVWFNDVTILSDDTNDIYLNSYGDGVNIDDPGVDDGSGTDNPFGDFNTSALESLIFIVLALVTIFFVCLVTITIALVAMFVRLGKVRKELGEINKNLDVIKSPPQQYQQPPSQPPVYQQPPPGYQQPPAQP